MLKKVHISEPEIKPCPHVVSFRCFVCSACVSSRTAYVCDAGHVVCKPCRRLDDKRHASNSNDMTNQLKAKAMLDVQRNAVCRNDLASGDHHHSCKYNQTAKSKSTGNIKTGGILSCRRKSVSDERIQLKNTETIVRFKNNNFCDSESSVPESINGKCVKHETENEESKCKRPVTCPVGDCHRILAPESVLKHFFFDHSKLPRVTLNSQAQVCVPLSSITEKILSYGIFLIKNTTSLSHAESGLMNGYKNASFLLMGVRMSSSAETIRKPHGSDITAIRHVQTQTDDDGVNTSKPQDQSKVSEKSNKPDRLKRSLTKGGAVVLWICKLVDSTFYYNMSITRQDKKLGYSVTGETLGIKDCQDTEMVNDHLGCLFVRGKAVEKLVNNKNQLEICINIFK